MCSNKRCQVWSCLRYLDANIRNTRVGGRWGQSVIHQTYQAQQAKTSIFFISRAFFSPAVPSRILWWNNINVVINSSIMMHLSWYCHYCQVSVPTVRKKFSELWQFVNQTLAKWHIVIRGVKNKLRITSLDPKWNQNGKWLKPILLSKTVVHNNQWTLPDSWMHTWVWDRDSGCTTEYISCFNKSSAGNLDKNRAKHTTLP